MDQVFVGKCHEFRNRLEDLFSEIFEVEEVADLRQYWGETTLMKLLPYPLKLWPRTEGV